MKLLLVSGNMHTIMSGYRSRKIDIINDYEIYLDEVLSVFQEVSPAADGILITDDALAQQSEQDKRNLASLMQWMKDNHKADIRVLILARDYMLEAELADLCGRYDNLGLLTYDFLRISKAIFTAACDELFAKERKAVDYQATSYNTSETDRKKSFLDRFRMKAKSKPEAEAADELDRQIEHISRGISRVVAVTGHRGSGLTSTAVNMAYEAGRHGLSTIIIDMDIDYRSINMYFSRFHEQANKDEHMDASLIRTLARPQDYLTTAFCINEKLWVASLGYSFSDRKLVEQFYNSSKLVGLISVLRNRFNLVVLDMPMDLFKAFKEAMIHIDTFGLCVSNNLHSILSTLRNIEVALDKESASYLNAKSKVIVTRYNDQSKFQNEIFTPDKVSRVLSSGLSSGFTYEMKVAGYVPFSYEFDAQIETDMPLANTSREHERAYGNILLRLIEGAK